MSAAEPDYIKSLKNGAVQKDGEAVAFEIETRDGKAHPFACNTDDLKHMLNWLIGLGLLADQKNPGSVSTKTGSTKKSIEAVPLEIKQMATGPGKSQGEFVIGFDLGAIDLAFSLPANAVDQLRGALASIAPE